MLPQGKLNGYTCFESILYGDFNNYGEAIMRKIMLSLAFLVLAFGYSKSYAQEVTYETTHPEIIKASLTSNALEIKKQDSLGTKIVIYSLIIGIYALYGFKQKI